LFHFPLNNLKTCIISSAYFQQTHNLKVPIDIFWLYVMLKNTLALIYTLVCSKTMTKFTFRRYKHSNLTISHFCPIKCSLEYSVPATKWSCC